MENTSKSNRYQEATNSIIDLLNQHQLSWDKPWISLNGRTEMAQNAESKRVYSLLNQILLCYSCSANSFLSNRWLTFKQISRLGGSIVKGSKASSIYFNAYVYFDSTGKKYDLEEVKRMSKVKEKELGITSKYYLTAYRLFNLAQTTGLPDAFYAYLEHDESLDNPIDLDQYAEEIIASTNAKIEYDKKHEACYLPKEDKILMPNLGQFRTADGFYDTIFHEFIHWTGHDQRISRIGITSDLKEHFAHEELIAELGAAFICSKLGISNTITNNAAYIQSWLESMKKDNRYVLKVVYEAEKAANWILNPKTVSTE